MFLYCGSNQNPLWGEPEFSLKNDIVTFCEFFALGRVSERSNVQFLRKIGYGRTEGGEFIGPFFAALQGTN